MQRCENENDIAWQIRCCLAKRRKETDMDWVEIRDMLGLDITPDQLRKQAVGVELYDNYIHNNSMIDNRILAISDLHIPFNLPIDIYKPYIGKVDTLVLNGDIEDCQSCSKYSRKYRIDVDKEMVATRDFLVELINMINPKKVIIVKGNHEHRMGRYLSDRLNEDLMSIMPDTPMDLIINEGFKVRDRVNKTETWYSPVSDLFKEYNIEVSYTGEWWRKVGKTIFAHPLSYSTGMLKTTEKAVEYFLRKDRDFNAVVLGHTHKLGSYIQGGIKMYEQGCCCDLSKIDYSDGYLSLPSQNGFIYMCQDLNGDIIPDTVKIVHL